MLGCQDADVFCRFTGVTRAGRLWKASIRVNKIIFLGHWWTEEQAAQAYDQAAIAFGVRGQAWAQLPSSAEVMPNPTSLLVIVPSIGNGCIKTQSAHKHW